MTTPEPDDDEPPPFDALAPEPDGFPRAGRPRAGAGSGAAPGEVDADDEGDADDAGYAAEADGGWDSGFGDAGPGNADSGD